MAANSTHKQPLSRLSLNAIMSHIACLDDFDIADPDMDALKAQIDTLLKGFPIIKTASRLPSVFRARNTPLRRSEIEYGYTHPFPTVKDLWYPPADKIDRPGRVNRPRQPVFYCASSEATAIAEVDPSIGDAVSILQCRFRGDAYPVLYAWDLGGFALDNHPTSRMALTLRSQIGCADMFKFYALRSYLDGHFTKKVRRGNEHEYYLTIAIFESLLERERTDIGPALGPADGLLYQSIAWNSGFNIALKPASADRLLIPTSCRMLAIRNVSCDPTTYKWWLLNEAREISDDGRIQWRWDHDNRQRLW